MSLASKITLATALATSAGIIGYVHYKQTDDREKLHEGVVRDIERQQRRKVENTYVLQKQIDLTKQLKDLQAAQDEKQQQQRTHVQQTQSGVKQNNPTANATTQEQALS